MKINGISGMYATIYHNGSYLLLFGRKEWHSTEIPYEHFFYFGIGAYLIQASPTNKHCTWFHKCRSKTTTEGGC